MDNLNLPKLYVGQKVVAVVTHSSGIYKEGQQFVIKGIKNPCCGYVVDIGILNPKRKMKCVKCSCIYDIDTGKTWFKQEAFKPIQESPFPSMTTKEVVEKELTLISQN